MSAHSDGSCFLQNPTCEAAIYTSTTSTCTLSYVRYADNLYAASGDANLEWWEPVYDV